MAEGAPPWKVDARKVILLTIVLMAILLVGFIFVLPRSGERSCAFAKIPRQHFDPVTDPIPHGAVAMGHSTCHMAYGALVQAEWIVSTFIHMGDMLRYQAQTSRGNISPLPMWHDAARKLEMATVQFWATSERPQAKQ